GDKIIGATDYDTYPEAAKDIERVSDSYTFNAERIVELNPDVVVAYTIGDEAQVAQLEEAGVKVFVIASAATFDDVYGDIEQLGDVVGQADKADEVIEEIQTQIEAVQEKTATIENKKKAYFEISPAPDIWTSAAGTFQNEVLTAAGVDNIFADQTGWFSVASEDVITRNPEIILTTVYYTEDPVGEIKSRTSWNTIQAIQNGQVYQLDGDVLSRPATRIGEAVELVAKTVYPELFK
ncbi:MAG: ABC transporter substrate-binding protein, partial [Lysinibacillus sp.]